MRFTGPSASPSPSLARSAELLREHGCIERTIRSGTSQWNTCLAFCIDNDRPPLPVKEAHVLASIGWVSKEREADRRRISSTSLAQYISAVRQMHLMSVGTPIPEYPLIHQVLRGNARWEEKSFPRPEVRFDISAEILRRIFSLGMTTESAPMLRNAAACSFSYCMNGLRESSVVPFSTGNVTICENKLSARLTRVKGRQTSNEQLVEYHLSGVRRFTVGPAEKMDRNPRPICSLLSDARRANFGECASIESRYWRISSDS